MVGVGLIAGVRVIVGVFAGVGVLVIVAVGSGLPIGVGQQEEQGAGVAAVPGMAELPLNTNWALVMPNKSVWL